MKARVLLAGPDAADWSRGLPLELDVTVTADSAAALVALRGARPFSVVGCDHRLRGADGATLLVEAGRVAPDTVRVLLGQHPDLATVVDAVNRADVFRVLTQPEPPDLLGRVLVEAAEHAHALLAERRRPEQAVSAAVDLVLDTLGLVDPAMFERAQRIRTVVLELGVAAGWPSDAAIDLAAALSQVGVLALPAARRQELGSGRRPPAALLAEVAEESTRLIGRLPVPAAARAAVRDQRLRYDGYGTPPGAPTGAHLSVGARLLRLAVDFDGCDGVRSPQTALTDLARDHAAYDPGLLAALIDNYGGRVAVWQRAVPLGELAAGMQLAEDIVTTRGVPLVGRGVVVTERLLERLRDYAQRGQLDPSISISVHG